MSIYKVRGKVEKISQKEGKKDGDKKKNNSISKGLVLSAHILVTNIRKREQRK